MSFFDWGLYFERVYHSSTRLSSSPKVKCINMPKCVDQISIYHNKKKKEVHFNALAQLWGANGPWTPRNIFVFRAPLESRALGKWPKKVAHTDKKSLQKGAHTDKRPLYTLCNCYRQGAPTDN